MDKKNIIMNEKNLTEQEIVELEQYKNIYCFNPIHKQPSMYTKSNRLILHKGDCIDYRYKIVNRLGNGAFSDVYSCKDYKDNQLVAVKVIKNEKRFHRQVKKEIEIYNLINEQKEKCSNVIPLNREFIFRTNQYLVFDNVGINLYEFIKKEHETTDILSFAWQIANGLSFIHNLDIIHCDLKPENIMLLNKRIKIIDFGSSLMFKKDLKHDYVQSRYYRSPEIVYELPITNKIDIWSYGCILYELYTRKPLIPAKSTNDLENYYVHILGYPPSDLISEDKFAYQLNSRFLPNKFENKCINEILDNIIFVGCLKWDPEKRVSATDLLTIPQHNIK